MASFMDYFSPSPRNESADPNETQAAWDSWLQDDKNRSALLQFGINLMQPFAPGQTGVGHFGQALGAAGEAMGRIDAEDLKKKVTEEELAGKTEDREIRREEAQGRREDRAAGRELQEGRLNLLGAQTELARDRVGYQAEKFASDREARKAALDAKTNKEFMQWVANDLKVNIKAENDSLANLGKPAKTSDQFLDDPEYLLRKERQYFREGRGKGGGGTAAPQQPVSSMGLTSGTKTPKPMSTEYLNQVVAGGRTRQEILSDEIHSWVTGNDPKLRERGYQALNALKASIADPGFVDQLLAGWKVKPGG